MRLFLSSVHSGWSSEGYVDDLLGAERLGVPNLRADIEEIILSYHVRACTLSVTRGSERRERDNSLFVCVRKFSAHRMRGL